MELSRGWAAFAPFALAALLAHGGFRLLVRPSRTAALSRAEVETARVAARVAEGEGRGESAAGAAEAEDLGRQLARTRERVAALSGILASGEEAERVLHSLHSLAAEEGVQFRRFAPEPEYRLDGYLARAASVVAEGGFFDFLRFFERVSLMPQLVLIEELEFDGSSGESLRGRFAAVTMRTLEPSSIPGDPAPEGGER